MTARGIGFTSLIYVGSGEGFVSITLCDLIRALRASPGRP